MSLASVRYTADGSTDEFDVTFPFISRSHVKVLVNGVPPILAPTWVGEARVKLNTVLIPGSVVEIKRETPFSDRLVNFTNGSVLTEEELNQAVKQVFYIQQEQKDLYDGALNSALINVATGNGYTNIDPDSLLDELAAEIIARNATLSLQQAIADIELNAQSIISTASRVDTLQSIVDAIIIPDTGGLAAVIASEESARIAGDTAIVDTLALLGAKNGAGTAWILDLNKVLVSPTESLSTRLTAITARLDAADASIVSEASTRATADSATAATVNSLLSRMTTAEAAITAESSTRASAIAAEATQRNALAARVTTAEAALVTEQTTRASADAALTATLAILGAKNGAGTAFILDTSKVEVDGGMSLGSRLSGIDAAVASANAAVATETTARVNADNALTSSINSLTARVSSAESIISTEQIARAAGDAASAELLTLLGTKSGDGTAFILNTNTTRINSTESLATRLNTISTTLNGNTNSISVLSSSINGLEGKYSVVIDQDENAVAGFELSGGGGASSTFRILADKFELVTPGTGFKPFRVEDGVTYIENAAIKNGTLSDVGTFFEDLNGRRITGTAYVWYDLTTATNQQVAATVNAGGTTGTKCVIDFAWVAARDGGDDDNLGLRVVRSDGYVLPQQLNNVQIAGGKRSYSAKFFDNSVPSSGDVSYRVQFQSQGDGFSFWYNVALTAILFKK